MKASRACVIGLNEMYESYQVKDLASLSGYKIVKPVGSEPYGWTSAIAYNPNVTKLILKGSYFFKNQRTYTRTDYNNGDIPSRLIGKQASRTAVWSLMETAGKRTSLFPYKCK